MEINCIFLNKLKKLYHRNFLYNESFIDFRDELNIIYPKAKEEIKNSSTILDLSQYKRYAQQEVSEINSLDFRPEDIEDDIIKERFKAYKISFLGINSILTLDNETGLYSDLFDAICHAPDERLAEELFKLQQDFLRYTKAWIANDIISYLNEKSKLEKVGNENPKVESYAWFEVGLLFATGEIDVLKKECNSNFREMARRKFPNNPDKFRPTISSSIGGTSKGRENIFNNLKHLKTIYDYCNKNNIQIAESFKNIIDSNQDD